VTSPPLLLACLFALVLAACGVKEDDSARRIDDDAVPYDLLDPDAPAIVPGRGRAVQLCLLEDDELRMVERPLTNEATRTDIVRALSALTDGEARTGLRTALGSGSEVVAVDVVGGTATVDFGAGAEEAITSEPLATVAQIVCTLTAQPGIGLVRFSIDGSPIEVPTADGTLTGDPVSRDDYSALLRR
jgi:spore germination protein GerM